MKSLVDCRRRTLRNRVRAAVRRSSVLKTAILAACAFAAVTLAWGCEEMGGRGKCPVEVETVATGLTEPRGMASGPDGRLYVAETGRDESGSRVVRIEEDGAATAVVAGLPIFLHGIEERLGAHGRGVPRRRAVRSPGLRRIAARKLSNSPVRRRRAASRR